MNKMLRTAFVLAALACANLLLMPSAHAQSVYGSIFGTVTDKTGAVIPGATVTVTDESKGTIVTATSNGSGDYSVSHLIPDVYDLKVEANGFKAFEAKGISVEADAAPRIDPTLDVGGAGGETVVVNADTQPELKTDRADVSTIFDQQQVSSLPVGDQNFTNLQLLLPGAQILGWSHASDENPQGSKQIQVDGQAFGGTAFELDGTDNQDPILGIIVINPTLDAVTETKITTQNFDAELGKAVSAVVTAQTRSGTNSFHGDAYDFRTGNANLARDPYSEPPGPNAIPAGLKNRFGGSLGGPVIRDKFFFFGNYEGQRQKVGTSNTDTVPTAQMIGTCLGQTTGPSGIAGCDFSQYAAVLSNGAQLIFDNQPGTHSAADLNAFAHNVVPTNLISPQFNALMTILQPYKPNAGGTTGVTSILNNFTGTGTGLFNSDQWTVRGDYTLSQTMHAFARFSRFTDTLSGKVMFGAAGGPGFGLGQPPYGGNSNGANDSLASGMDIAINPTLLTDFRLAYYRYNIIDTKFDQGVAFATQLGIPGVNLGDNFTSGAPGFIVAYSTNTPSASNSTNESLIGGGLGINRCNCPLTEREDQFQIVNNWTKIIGNHSIKVGADLRYGRNLRVPSDTDRAGQFNFYNGPTSDGGSFGLPWATFALGDVGEFGRYVGNTTVGEQNAKEFQKRTFFYAQDTWRVTHNLTLNLGLRYEIYFPEAVNGVEHGSLMNLADGYMHVAGVGGVPTDMGWGISWSKQFDPRIGLTYQLGPKTVIRAGYGRSFDTGVFGSIFGHVVTQNLPVLANQSINSPSSSNTTTEFTLAQGPPAFQFPTVPSNGLLPAEAYAVSPKARPNPLHFPTIDAWNLSAQRALTPTLTLTVAYVANKGTHTLGDGDSNNTNPNEAALFLPGAYSSTGQTVHWDPNGPSSPNASGATSNSNYLQRYFASSLPACKDPNYLNPQPNGACGWTQGISYYGDDQNTEFDAMQVTLAQNFTKGLSLTGNYQWAAAFDEASGYYTWSHTATHQRDGNVRNQQFTTYGSYDLPFGKGKQYISGANRALDLLIGGYQLSTVLDWAGGLPWSVGYDQFDITPGAANPENCNFNVGGTSAPCRPNAFGHMKTGLTSFDPVTRTRSFFNAQPRSGGIFSFPGLDNIGNAGANTYIGPTFFNTDLAISKTFTIWESVAAKFRMDAFNAFNHINAGQPNNGDVFVSTGTSVGSQANNINGEAPGAAPRQLEFSMRIQF